MIRFRKKKRGAELNHTPPDVKYSVTFSPHHEQPSLPQQ